jgi:hypothetical protein
MRGSHRLCATAIAGVAGLSLLVSRRIIIVHLFLDVNFQGSPKIKAQPRRAPQPTAVRPMITVIVKTTLAQLGNYVLDLKSLFHC